MKKDKNKNKKKLTKEDVDDMITIYDKFGFLEKFKKLSSGKKLAIGTGAVCVLIAVIVALVMVLKPDYAADVSLIEVTKGDVTETISSTGTVVSKSKTTYKIFDGIKVKDVKVALGESVKKGQVLATFDVSSAKDIVDEKKEAYDQAKKSYEDMLEAAETAKVTLPELEKKIAELEKKIEAAEAAAEANGEQPAAEEDTNLLEKLEALIDNLSNLGVSFDMASMLGTDSASMNLQIEYIELVTQKTTLEAQSNATTQELYKSLMLSSKKTYEEYSDAYDKLKNGWKAEKDGIITTLNIAAGDSYNAQTSGAASQAIDINTIMSAINGGVDVNQLISSFTSSNLTTGMVIDNYDDFEIDFTISKYDIPKVKLNQKAVVTALDEDFDGHISYISPTMAASSGGLDLSSLTGALTGGTASSGLNAKIKIDNPNESVIIGLTVDILLETDSVTDVTVVPLEGIEIDGSTYYVYVYNEDSKTIEKRELEVGISSDTLYQIISGCEVGDKLVKNPTNALVDGSMVKVIK